VRPTLPTKPGGDTTISGTKSMDEHVTKELAESVLGIKGGNRAAWLAIGNRLWQMAPSRHSQAAGTERADFGWAFERARPAPAQSERKPALCGSLIARHGMRRMQMSTATLQCQMRHSAVHSRHKIPLPPCLLRVPPLPRSLRRSGAPRCAARRYLPSQLPTLLFLLGTASMRHWMRRDRLDGSVRQLGRRGRQRGIEPPDVHAC
jgi:hypothetical protein